MATQESSPPNLVCVKFYKTICFLQLISSMRKKIRAIVNRSKETRDIPIKQYVGITWTYLELNVKGFWRQECGHAPTIR